jgi:hypothetical protein
VLLTIVTFDAFAADALLTPKPVSVLLSIVTLLVPLLAALAFRLLSTVPLPAAAV